MYSYIASKGGWQFNNSDTVIINNNFAQPVDSLFFDTSVPSNNVDTAKMRWDSELATVVLGMYDQVPNELGFKNFWLVKNQTGSTITKGSIVYANGTVGASGTGEFASLFKKIDGANQAAKDIEQRLLPFLKGNQAKATGNKVAELGQDMVRWKEISKALQNVEKDPVAASRQLRVLTGLDSVGEVADLVSKRFIGSVMQH